MAQELLRLIYDYSQKDNGILNDYIYKVVQTAVNYLELDKWINDIKIDDPIIKNQLNVPAAYNYSNHTLHFDSFALEDEGETERDWYEDYFAEKESKMLKYIFIAQIILHELEHVYQKGTSECIKIEKAKRDLNKMLEIDLIMMSFTGNKSLKEKKYIYHEVIPNERFAEINSWIKIEQIIRELNNPKTNLLDYCKSRKFNSLLLGYDESDAPTGYYMNAVNYDSQYVSYYTNLDIAKTTFPSYYVRATFGMPLAEEEKTKIESQIIRKYIID